MVVAQRLSEVPQHIFTEEELLLNSHCGGETERKRAKGRERAKGRKREKGREREAQALAKLSSVPGVYRSVLQRPSAAAATATSSMFTIA